MSTTVANPFQAMPSAPQAASGREARAGVTSGLLKLIGSMKSTKPLNPAAPATAAMPGVVPGSSAVLLPQVQASQPTAVSRPMVPEPVSSSSPFAVSSIQHQRAGLTPLGQISFEELMSAAPNAGASGPVSGLDNLRHEMFGRYYEETESRMKEMRMAMETSVAQVKKSALDRIDELGAAMHRDLVALRQETHHELEDIKRDIFSAVMSISALNDKLGVADARVRDVTTSLTRSLVDRVEQQAQSFEHTMRGMQQRLDEMIGMKVSSALQRAIHDMIQVQQRQQAQPPPVPTLP